MYLTVLRLGAVALALNAVGATAAMALDQNLPAYRPVAALSGHIKSVGSDTLGREAELWVRAFGKLYPDVKIDVEAKGSATAPRAVLDGTAQFGPMSRPMTAEETAAFEEKYGYKVSRLRVAVDALAVYVNKDNPIPCLTLPQVSGIFASTHMAPGSVNVKTWGDLDLTGEWAARPITLYSRNFLSGTYEYFRETALYGGDYKPDIKQLPGSEALWKASPATNSGSAIPASATRPTAFAPSRWLPTMVRLAMTSLPSRRFPANTRSHATSMCTSIKTRPRHSIRFAPSS
jgi:phosphate transport system substrate-binding protein